MHREVYRGGLGARQRDVAGGARLAACSARPTTESAAHARLIADVHMHECANSKRSLFYNKPRYEGTRKEKRRQCASNSESQARTYLGGSGSS